MMTNNKLLSALGLCRRAGKLQAGFDAAVNALERGAPMAVFASDVSERTRRNITRVCRDTVRIAELGHTQGELEAAVGKRFVVAAVCDENFAKLIETSLQNSGNESSVKDE